MSELARIETVVFLQSVDLFSYCKAEEVLRIAAISQERSFEDGERIYSVNDPSEFVTPASLTYKSGIDWPPPWMIVCSQYGGTK